MHHRTVELVRTFACGLGGIHRQVRVPKKPVSITRSVSTERDTDARPRGDCRPLDIDRCDQGHHNSRAGIHDASLIADVLEQNRGFVSAETSRAVRRTERLAYPSSDDHEELITGGMT